MSREYFDRYQFFEEEGNFRIVPGIEIPIKTSDKYIFYKNKLRKRSKFFLYRGMIIHTPIESPDRVDLKYVVFKNV